MLFFIFLFFVVLMGNVVAFEMKKVVYIDPGHGGYDGGAYVDGIKESDLNLKISLYLKDIYEKNGYKVLMTRETDEDLSTDDKFRKSSDIKNRVELINESNCILYISIHQNIYSNSKYSGAQCFYNKYNELSSQLASNIQSSIINHLNNTNRVSKAISGIYLIDNVDKPGVLIECGFMSNKEELSLLTSDDYQYKIANSIYYGTLNYLMII